MCVFRSLEDAAVGFGFLFDHNVFRLALGGPGSDDALHLDDAARRWLARRLGLLVRLADAAVVGPGGVRRVDGLDGRRRGRRAARDGAGERRRLRGLGRLLRAVVMLRLRLLLVPGFLALEHLRDGPTSFQQLDELVGFAAQVAIRSEWIVLTRFRAASTNERKQ